MTELPGTEVIPTGDADESEPGVLDLTPRAAKAVDRKGRRRLVPSLVLGIVIIALGFVVLRTLGDAALFFYNADEAIERRDELVGERFRVQGTPFGEPVSVEIAHDGRDQVGVVFPIAFDGKVIDIVHVGSPAELFQPGVPVVLEGTWVATSPPGVDSVDSGANDGWYFASTDMVVKHDNEYRTENDERLEDAERGGFSPEP